MWRNLLSWDMKMGLFMFIITQGLRLKIIRNWFLIFPNKHMMILEVQKKDFVILNIFIVMQLGQLNHVHIILHCYLTPIFPRYFYQLVKMELLIFGNLLQIEDNQLKKMRHSLY